MTKVRAGRILRTPSVRKMGNSSRFHVLKEAEK